MKKLRNSIFVIDYYIRGLIKRGKEELMYQTMLIFFLQNNKVTWKKMALKDDISLNKAPRVKQKFQMKENHLSYNVGKDLTTTKCNITFRELLEVSPKIRSQVSNVLVLNSGRIRIATMDDNYLEKQLNKYSNQD